ncbi:PPA6, partial [Symbiodinium pilosum]
VRFFSSYSPEVVGSAGTPEYRMHFKDGNGNKISPWHDIPLKSGELFNCLIEIPKMTKPKMEVAVKEEMNPIAQDVKKGAEG